jgi:gamma-glutamyltranspeptidase / glutathione hydrolase
VGGRERTGGALAHDGVLANATNTRALEEHHGAAFEEECFFVENGKSGSMRFRQPLLARTLEQMAAQGAEWFYRGPLAAVAERAWHDAGLTLGAEAWRSGGEGVRTVAAASYEVGGIRLNSGPLGLSGSACLFATFEGAARIARETVITQPEGLAALAGAMASLWQHRFAHNDFTAVPIEAWIEAALANRDAGRAGVVEAAHTAHLNACDADGMMAALTFTHGPAWFGGRWALPGTGVVMNGGMHNFRRSAPVRDGERLLGASNMAPTLADDGRGGRVALGCPGARRIPSNIAMVLARRYLAGESLQDAVSGGRLHAEGRERVTWEDARLPHGTYAALQTRFAKVEPEDSRNYFGPLSALGIDAAGAIELALDDRDWRAFGARA